MGHTLTTYILIQINRSATAQVQAMLWAQARLQCLKDAAVWPWGVVIDGKHSPPNEMERCLASVDALMLQHSWIHTCNVLRAELQALPTAPWHMGVDTQAVLLDEGVRAARARSVAVA